LSKGGAYAALYEAQFESGAVEVATAG